MSLPVRFWREYPQNQDNHYPKIEVATKSSPNFGVTISFVYGYGGAEMRMLACGNT